MSATSVTLAGRRAAESLMLDTGQASRPLENQWVVVDGVEVQATAPLFGSVCKIQTREVQARESEVGGRTAVEVRMELHLPVDTAPLTAGDVWGIAAAHPLSLSVAGQRFRVVGPVAGTFKTARRYQIEEVVS